MTLAPLDEAGVCALVHGGAVLGCGGGGSIATGLADGRAALAAGAPRILPMNRIADDATLATLSIVGSALESAGAELGARHFRRALDVFGSFADQAIDGLIASEVGPRAVTYGLMESARTGIPVVDAPANGRAHPLFVMGALGLHRRPRLAMTTVAVGGQRASSAYVEIAIRANVRKAAGVVRDRAAQDRIALAVVRNAVPAAFVRAHGAVGGLAFAHRLGGTLLNRLPDGCSAVVRALARLLGGRVLATGVVESARLSEQKGFTIGSLRVRRARGPAVCVSVCNEFMTVTDPGGLDVRFPDLIALFDHDSALPIASTEARVDRPVTIFWAPRSRLLLGSTMRDPGLLRQIEVLTGAHLLT